MLSCLNEDSYFIKFLIKWEKHSKFLIFVNYIWEKPGCLDHDFIRTFLQFPWWQHNLILAHFNCQCSKSVCGLELTLFWLLEVAPPSPPPKTLHADMPDPNSYRAPGNCINGFLHIICLNVKSYKAS